MTYLLDTNVFIDAKARSYGMDFCPGFWDWLVIASASERVASIVQVLDEIQDDELRDWLPALGDKFFRKHDKAVLGAMSAISQWVAGEKYMPAARSTFFAAADYHLIAHAMAGGHTVVTHEQIEHTPARIKIPNVCIALGVDYARTDQMLRREKARFVLGGPTASAESAIVTQPSPSES